MEKTYLEPHLHNKVVNDLWSEVLRKSLGSTRSRPCSAQQGAYCKRAGWTGRRKMFICFLGLLSLHCESGNSFAGQACHSPMPACSLHDLLARCGPLGWSVWQREHTSSFGMKTFWKTNKRGFVFKTLRKLHRCAQKTSAMQLCFYNFASHYSFCCFGLRLRRFIVLALSALCFHRSFRKNFTIQGLSFPEQMGSVYLRPSFAASLFFSAVNRFNAGCMLSRRTTRQIFSVQLSYHDLCTSILDEVLYIISSRRCRSFVPFSISLLCPTKGEMRSLAIC